MPELDIRIWEADELDVKYVVEASSWSAEKRSIVHTETSSTRKFGYIPRTNFTLRRGFGCWAAHDKSGDVGAGWFFCFSSFPSPAFSVSNFPRILVDRLSTSPTGFLWGRDRMFRRKPRRPERKLSSYEHTTICCKYTIKVGRERYAEVSQRPAGSATPTITSVLQYYHRTVCLAAGADHLLTASSRTRHDTLHGNVYFTYPLLISQSDGAADEKVLVSRVP